MIELTKIEAQHILYAIEQASSLLEEDPAASPEGVLDLLYSAEEILKPCIDKGDYIMEVRALEEQYEEYE